MSDDLRSLIKEAAAEPTKPLAFGDVLQGGSQLRRRRRVARLGMVVLAGMVAWSLVTSLNAGESERQTTPVAAGGLGSADRNSKDESAYSFSNVTVQQTDSATAVMNFDYQWTTSEFPGVRECSFFMYGDTGEIVGERTRHFAVTKPAGRSTSELEVSVSGAASSATIDCGPRLDDPAGSYTFTNVRIIEPEGPGAEEVREVLIKADAEWTGRGTTAGVAECRKMVFGGDGQEMLAETTTFSAESDENQPSRAVVFTLMLPKEVQRPSSADVDCIPYRG